MGLRDNGSQGECRTGEDGGPQMVLGVRRMMIKLRTASEKEALDAADAARV